MLPGQNRKRAGFFFCFGQHERTLSENIAGTYRFHATKESFHAFVDEFKHS